MKIDKLPFYYKAHLKNDNGGLPQTVPFDLYYDEDLELLKQKPSDSLKELLAKVYLDGSLVDGSVSSESGLHYVSPVVKYVSDHAKLNSESKVLEIGFGSGIFLSEFVKLGVKEVVGIEPGNHKLCDNLDGVRLFSDFYPSEQFTDKVDLIFHCLVLEHIEDPVSFLKYQKGQLSVSGKIVFLVPNEEPFLAAGDCSSFIHEHFNFFTKRSVKNVVERAGLHIHDISIIEGLLAVTVGLEISDYSGKDPDYFKFDYQTYMRKISEGLAKLEGIVKRFDNDSDIAIYVPGRGMNFMYLLNRSDFRLVDDSTEIQGKYLPFLNKPIESWEELIKNPPSAILIFSRTFGEKIKKRCLEIPGLTKCEILTLDDILN